MSDRELEKLFADGLRFLNSGDILYALACFEKAALVEDSPLNKSYRAFCMAKERGLFKKAIDLCESAIKEENNNSVHYLNLGRIYLLADQKSDAIRVFREGLGHEQNKQIIDELDRLSTRKAQVIPFLKRENPINKYLGMVLGKLRLR